MSEQKTVLVTGAAGLIGNAACLMLADRGTSVIATDRVAPTDERTTNVACDLTDVHGLHALAGEHRIGAVVHCAALSGPMVARDNPHAMVQVNVVGTANLLEIARVHRVPRFIFCSSSLVYGNTQPGPVPEDVPLRPTTVYAASKASGEHLVAAYATQFGIDGVSLRFCFVYGPRRTTDCPIRTMLLDALDGRKTRLRFGLDFPRQFVHVDDAARAILSAIDRPALPRQTYTITGGQGITLGRVAEMVRQVMPQADIVLGPGPDPADDLQHEFDISAAERDLGYRPLVSLEDGVREYAAWLAARRHQDAAA